MRVRTLRLRGVMSHPDTRITLPAAGVVVITGTNGSGKSAIVEAVAVAAWGKTLRGTPPWDETKQQCQSEIETDAVRVKRGLRRTKSGTKGSVELEWDSSSEDTEAAHAAEAVRRLGPTEWENVTKAQEALERIIGPMDVWRRSSAFSGSDAAHFSMATDAERKRTLEAILGLDRFDEALEACRADLKEADKAAAELQRWYTAAEASVAAETRRLADAEATLTEMAGDLDVPDQAAMDAKVKECEGIQQSINNFKRDAAGLRAKLREADAAGGGFDALAKQAEALLERLQRETCPTCTQPIADKLRKKAQIDARAAHGHAEAARTNARSGRDGLVAAIAELDEDLRGLEERRTKEFATLAHMTSAINNAKRTAAARAVATKTATNAREALTAARAKEEDLRKAVLAADKGLDTLKAVETVLGMRGVRAHVLGKSLTGIEAVANAWLVRLGLSKLSVQMLPYSEKKTGGVIDAISVEVRGAGGGYGYKATSAGERKRVDVALLLGLAEVAAASAGRLPGTLWFDELFDALDSEGVNAASTVLSELAKDRCVVVITHNQELADRIDAAKRLHVNEGQVT